MVAPHQVLSPTFTEPISEFEKRYQTVLRQCTASTLRISCDSPDASVMFSRSPGMPGSESPPYMSVLWENIFRDSLFSDSTKPRVLRWTLKYEVMASCVQPSFTGVFTTSVSDLHLVSHRHYEDRTYRSMEISIVECKPMPFAIHKEGTISQSNCNHNSKLSMVHRLPILKDCPPSATNMVSQLRIYSKQLGHLC